MSSSRSRIDQKLFLVEEKLNQATTEFEEHAQTFVECVQTVKGDRQSIKDCGDAVDYLLASKALNSDASKLTASTVKALLTFLVDEASVEGAGDVVWKQIARLVMELGLVLPTSYKAGESDEVSLHQVAGEQNDDLLVLWEQLRVKMKAFYSAKLLGLPDCLLDGSAMDRITKIERCQVVQGLCLFYEPIDVLQWYGQLRKRQFESNSYMQTDHCISDGKLVRRFIDWIPITKRMISEDLVILQDHCFMETAKITPTDFLKNIYLSVVVDKIRNVLASVLESGQKCILTMNDILTLSSLISTCQQFDNFLLRFVTLTRCPPTQPVVRQRLSSILKSPRRPLDILSSVHVHDLKQRQLPPVRTPQLISSTDKSLQPIGETLITEHEQPDFHSNVMWEWSIVFEPYIPLVNLSIETVMMSSVQGFIEEEKGRFTETSQLPTIKLPDAGIPHASVSELPIRIIKSCQSVVNIIKGVLSIVNAGKSIAFIGALNTFTSVLDRTLATYMDHIKEMADGVPNRVLVQCLYPLLSSTTYLSLVLHECHLIVNVHSSAPRVAAVCGKVDDLQHCLAQQLMKYHCNVCAKAVLQDAESNFYADPKPFYEDERSSFSIQMWNYYLQSVKHDLWTTLSPRLAKKLLGNIVGDGLGVLSARYSNLEVSEARKKQYRADIVATLSVASTFVWAVCELDELLAYGASAVRGKDVTASSVSSFIWNHCNKLLKSLISCHSTALETSNCDWLEFIEPQLFTHEMNASDLVLGIVRAKWLVEQPAIGCHELLELLVMNDCAICQILCQSLEPSASEKLACALWDILVLSSPTLLSRTAMILDQSEGDADKQESWHLFEHWLVSNVTHLVIEEAICLPVFALCCELAESAAESQLCLPSIQVPEEFQTYLQTNHTTDISLAVSTCLNNVFEELRMNILSLPYSLLYCLKILIDDKPLPSTSVDSILLCCCQVAIQQLSRAPIISAMSGCRAVIGEVENQLEALKRTGSRGKPYYGNKLHVSLKNVVDKIKSFHVPDDECVGWCQDKSKIKSSCEALSFFFDLVNEVWSSVLKKQSLEVTELLEKAAGVSSLPHLNTSGDAAGSDCSSEQFYPLQSYSRIGSKMYDHVALLKAGGVFVGDTAEGEVAVE